MSVFAPIIGFLDGCSHNRSVSVAAVFAIAAIGLVGVAHAAPEQLVCLATDTNNGANMTTGNIVIDINDSAQDVAIISSHWGMLIPGAPAQITRYDSTEIDFQVSISNGSVSAYMTINRITGEFTVIQKDNITNEAATFTGSCTKGAQKF